MMFPNLKTQHKFQAGSLLNDKYWHSKQRLMEALTSFIVNIMRAVSSVGIPMKFPSTIPRINPILSSFYIAR